MSHVIVADEAGEGGQKLDRGLDELVEVGGQALADARHHVERQNLARSGQVMATDDSVKRSNILVFSNKESVHVFV